MDAVDALYSSAILWTWSVMNRRQDERTSLVTTNQFLIGPKIGSKSDKSSQSVVLNNSAFT